MADAEQADPDVADAGDFHGANAGQLDFDTDFGSSAQQDSHLQQQQPQQAAWVLPRAPEVSEDLGLNGFYADVQQQVRPPKEELDKRLPGRDGSLLVKGSPVTIAEALEGDAALTQHNQQCVSLHIVGIKWAGRVRFFLSHSPPGVSNGSEVSIAHVHWYTHLPERDAMSLALGCPVFKASYKDDTGGNMWPVEKLAPCQFSAVYHKTRKECVVILSRFSSFLESVPGYKPKPS